MTPIYPSQNPGEDLIELQSIPSDFTIYLDNEEDLTVDRIKMENILGQGAFGLVRKAIITMGDREETVAVKMLRSNRLFYNGPLNFSLILFRTRQ